MEIFLDALIVIADSSVADGVDMVCIVETIVAKIVANTADKDWEEI